MNLKLKKNFIIIEEALHKLYYLITLITFLKSYFSTKHNIQKTYHKIVVHREVN